MGQCEAINFTLRKFRGNKAGFRIICNYGHVFFILPINGRGKKNYYGSKKGIKNKAARINHEFNMRNRRNKNKQLLSFNSQLDV
jgi:hypothetical protein